jgi:hypothetical protein
LPVLGVHRGRLALASERWGELTSLYPHQITAFILAGIRPRHLETIRFEYRPIKRSVWYEPDVQREEITIRIDRQDLTARQFTAVFSAVRKWLGLSRAKLISRDDESIRKAVAAIHANQTGTPTKAEYRRALKRLPSRLRTNLTPEALRERYLRLQARLDKRGLAGLNG